jgi:SAM-dependent methyltransferase
MAKKNDVTFAGAIPENYDRYLGPLLFVPYARDLANRLPTDAGDVLELACGTGIFTQILSERLSEASRLVATDISDGMIEIAKKKTINKKVDWKVVDATSLPFKDNSFDFVVCQFGVMFFPDKDAAAREIHRVLRAGGRLLFNVWDSLRYNDFARTVNEVVTEMFGGETPKFYSIPFGYHDHYAIRTLLRGAGFSDIGLTTVESKVQSEPGNAALGFVEGNPIVVEIKERLGSDVKEAVGKVEKALASSYGQRMSKGRAQAIVVGGRKAAELSTNGKAAVRAPEPAAAKPKKATASKPAKPKPKPKPSIVRATKKGCSPARRTRMAAKPLEQPH